MTPEPQRLDERLAKALSQIEELTSALADARASQKKAEFEAERQAEAARTSLDELHQFVYAASHDLQEPLRSVSTYTQLLQRRFTEDQEAAELASFITDGVNRMNRMIRDLLNYSRIANELRRTTIDLSAIVQWALMKVADPVRESQATINYAHLPEAPVDESRMATVFENLFLNAIKYRSSDPPRIDIAAEETDEAYLISVSDNGEGIEPRFHKQVFVPFKRLHGKEIPGTGLGLAISKKIVEAHGGQIWVESDGEHGSVFKFTIPY